MICKCWHKQGMFALRIDSYDKQGTNRIGTAKQQREKDICLTCTLPVCKGNCPKVRRA